MTNQTHAGGRRLEALYEACMDLPAEEREQFLQRHTGDDIELAGQLRQMIRLPVSVTDSTSAVAGQSAIDLSELESGELKSGDLKSGELKCGTVFGNCRIVSEIGAGGMGAVYLALDLLTHNRPVALKVMKPTMLGEADRQRFINETSALSRLVHPNIARLYFCGIQLWNGADRPYLVMEYIEGQTLDIHLREQNLTTGLLLQLLRKISLAVHHGHLKGVFHRDLKPSNILVTSEGEPKVIDFGVSFMVSTDSNPGQETALRENAGTLPYMAPEVAGGAAFVPDPRTDVYSLGIIAFEAFAKRWPGVELPSGDVESLDRLGGGEIRRMISQCERERLRGVGWQFNRDLDCVVSRALRLKMEDRYNDTSELAEDFRRLIDLEPVRARPASRFYVASMFVRRNRLAVVSSVMVFLAITTAAVGFGVGEAHAIAARKQVEKQNAAAHFLAAGLAEQRGNWSVAVDEFRAAERGQYPDRLALAVGELRALGRLDNRGADIDALIKHVRATMPEIARSPQFQIVEGFIAWSSKPAESLATIRQALVHADQLETADRAFAEALTTEDIRTVAARLGDTIRADPFNHDAWILLAFCDLAMGDAAKSLEDAGVLQKLYPQDQVGDLLAAMASAFQGRETAALAHLNRCTNLPTPLKSTLTDVIRNISQIGSIDDIGTLTWLPLLQALPSIYTAAFAQTEAHSVPIPLTFRRLFTMPQLLAILTRGNDAQTAVEVWPNGNGEYASGELAFVHHDYAGAIHHFESALSMPCLINCRRRAIFFLTVVHVLDKAVKNIPSSQWGSMVRSDLDRLISQGGVHPDQYNEESYALVIADVNGYQPQMRSLALLWLARVPDDSSATYYLAAADARLGDQGTALALYRRAVASGRLSKELTAKANTAIGELSAASNDPRPK